MSDSVKDTIQVRQGEELNVEAVQKCITEQIESAPASTLKIEQVGAGHSNLTYLLKIGSWQAVLRRPPLGPVAPKAHDMEREYKILSSLHPHYPVAPNPYVYAADEAISGSPFFMMERRQGIGIDTSYAKELTYQHD